MDKNLAPSRTVLILTSLFVLAVAGAIIFPLFSTCTTGARINPDLTYIKQLGIATHIYATDYDNRYPHASQMPGLRSQLQPYCRNSTLFEGLKGKYAAKQFNFNLAAVNLYAIPLGSKEPLEPEETAVWYAVSLNPSKPGAYVSRMDTSTKLTKLPVLRNALRYRYPRPANSLAPADYIADPTQIK